MLDEKGSRRRLAVTNADPAKVRAAQQVEESYPPRADAPYGAMNVMRTGEPELVADIPDALLTAMSHDAKHLHLIRKMGAKSYICVPIKSFGKMLGAISFIIAESDHRYDTADLRLALDLAHRAAVAIRNANLYVALQETDRRKDEFLATLAHELRNPLAPMRNSLEIMKRARRRHRRDGQGAPDDGTTDGPDGAAGR